ncbi:MAG: hypothetical protein LBG96_12050 [Tannerella sp.]|jgi:hypothetical protein|nr:hypothetical protein [Tannerella sp.]
MERIKRESMKSIAVLLLASLLLSSCFSTRYVSVEPELKKEFKGATVEDVEFEFGEPEEVEDTASGGYAYVYYGNGYAFDRRGRARKQEDTYMRFLFDQNGMLRYVRSNQVKGERKFSAGDTVFTIVFFTIIVPGVIIGLAAAKQ